MVRLLDVLGQRGAHTHFALEQRWGTEVQRHVDEVGAAWTGVPIVASLGCPRSLTELRWWARSWMRSSADLTQVSMAYEPRQLLATNINVAFFARRLARNKKLVSVFRVPNPPGESLNRAKKVFDRWAWKTVYASYDRVVCNACHTAQKVADIVDDDAKICVIKNLPPSRRDIEKSDSPAKRPRLKRIAYVGQITREKGVDHLVKACAGLLNERKDFELVLAGADRWLDSFGHEVRSWVRSMGLDTNIRFVGQIDDINGLLSSADIHVCPSVSESDSFPNVVIEAKAAGVPSVVFPIAGLPEAVSHGVDGIVTAEPSVSALAKEISILLTDTTLRRKLAEGARRSLQEFDEEQIAAKWVEILSQTKPWLML